MRLSRAHGGAVWVAKEERRLHPPKSSKLPFASLRRTSNEAGAVLRRPRSAGSTRSTRTSQVAGSCDRRFKFDRAGSHIGRRAQARDRVQYGVAHFMTVPASLQEPDHADHHQLYRDDCSDPRERGGGRAEKRCNLCHGPHAGNPEPGRRPFEARRRQSRPKTARHARDDEQDNQPWQAHADQRRVQHGRSDDDPAERDAGPDHCRFGRGRLGGAKQPLGCDHRGGDRAEQTRGRQKRKPNTLRRAAASPRRQDKPLKRRQRRTVRASRRQSALASRPP